MISGGIDRLETFGAPIQTFSQGEVIHNPKKNKAISVLIAGRARLAFYNPHINIEDVSSFERSNFYYNAPGVSYTTTALPTMLGEGAVATALTECSTVRFPEDMLNPLRAPDPSLALFLLRATVNRIICAETAVIAYYARKNPAQSIAESLLERLENPDEQYPITSPVTQEALTIEVGTSRRNTGKYLEVLVREELIYGPVDERYVILDKPELTRVRFGTRKVTRLLSD